MSCSEAHSKSLELVPYTCGPVMDVFDYLADKYQISDDDARFARHMVIEQTKRLRRALVRQIEGGSDE